MATEEAGEKPVLQIAARERGNTWFKACFIFFHSRVSQEHRNQIQTLQEI